MFIPPLRKPVKNESSSPSKPIVSATAAVPVVPTSFATDRPTHANLVSNVSSFYENAPTRNRYSRKSILPLSAQAVQPSQGGRLDPLAIARSPPPWKIMDIHKSSAPPNSQGASSDNVESSRQRQPIARWTGQALNNPLRVDRTRLHKRSSDAATEIVHQFTSKRLKVESEFVLAKTRAGVPIESRNPFVRSARSVFAESSTSTSDKARHLADESSKEAGLDMQLRACRSLPSKTVRQQGTNIEGIVKPLKPITQLRPPVLPKELLPSSPRHASKPKTDLKQRRLAFAREGYPGSVEHG